jgi:DNA ligase D-like protein (predicted 3'-phosphoesterase)
MATIFLSLSEKACRIRISGDGGIYRHKLRVPVVKKDSLTTYTQKRDFEHTPEPKAVKAKASAKGRVFVVQKHDASHLHYDFRIEVDGVLKSWAVPKGPSMDPANKRLAVPTEDHPLEYAGFEGTIPEDQYGGGTVMVWDSGVYRNLKEQEDGTEMPMAKTVEHGRIEIWLDGKKLRGGFALVRTRMVGKQQQWLLIKMKDDEARPGKDILVEKPDSAISGRSLEAIRGK